MRIFSAGPALLLVIAAACSREAPAPGAAPPPRPAPTRLLAEPTASVRPPAPEPPRPSAPARPGFLKGQTHVHSSRSYDAHTEPDRVLAFYKARGYDFVALTDHNRVTVIEPPAGLILVPGVELSQNSATCDPKPSPGYRCLFHTSGLFVDPARDARHGERIPMPFRPRRLDAYQQQLEIVDGMGGLPVLNHPLFHFAADGRMIAELARRGVRLVELWNASLARQHPSGRDSAEDRAEAVWDEVLSTGALVYATASDDAHHFDDVAERARAGKFAYEGDKGWTMVRAERSAPAIREALRSGDFYSTTGVLLEELSAAPDAVRLRVAPGSSGVHRIRFVGKGGRVLARAEGTEASYAPKGDEGYVRAVVEDGQGRRAWVQPVMLPARGSSQ